jgi:glycosyltransferase involved in cell wall biosynthesis
MQKRLLFLITPSPPFEPGEEFLSAEIPLLASTFSTVIVIHHEKDYTLRKSLPANFKVVYLPYLPTRKEKAYAVINIFRLSFWHEFFQIIFKYKMFPSHNRLACALGAYVVGNNLKECIQEHCKEFKDHKTYAYSYWCNFMAMGLALLKKSNPDFTCISRAHGYDVYFERSDISYLPFRKFIYANLDRVYFISQTGYDYALLKNGFFPSCRVSRLGSRGVAKQNKVHEDNHFHIVSCSSLISLKRVHLIVEALCLWKHDIAIHWLHFGDGPLREKTIQQAIEMLQSNTQVTFHFAGYTHNEAVLTYYQQHSVDAIINVSESEGIPFSIIEAYAAGIPAIATHVGGVHEIVKHKQNGFLLPSNPTPLQLHTQLSEYLLMPTQDRMRVSENAFTTWQLHFQATTNYKAFIDDFL